ncbi:hypothetical protein L484_016366 [Morus notabilis]|uniref:Uncharacterized protein n=1 Tax=Morus notabilis TaxID=981085 RepID=W9RYQ9_9ROSA|nr:hypothetical protein L484_016366 [Morus notabilis]
MESGVEGLMIKALIRVRDWAERGSSLKLFGSSALPPLGRGKRLWSRGSLLSYALRAPEVR